MDGNENGHSTEFIYNQIEEIYDELDADIENRKKLMDFVQCETLSNILLHHPWNDPKKLTTFLRIIIAVKKYAVDDRPSILAAYDKVLKSDLLKTAIAENIPKMKESNQRNRILAKLFHYVIEILLFGYENHLTKMDDYESDVGFIVTSLKSMDALLEMTKENFLQLEKKYTIIQKRKAEMAQKKAKTQFKNRKFTGNATPPPEDFRYLPLIPSPTELAIDYVPYLRSAKIFKPYFDSEQYLDVQFRLLREDLISPLRTGIEEVKTGKSRMHCYKSVKIVEYALHLPSAEYIHYVKIHENQQNLCKKTLKNFSLLCLSSDKYQKEFLFASVADRDECLIYDGKIGIKFVNENQQIDFTKEYLMVESPAYFEAYRHVLSALQNIPQYEILPFAKYLIHGQTETQLPGFTDGRNIYDFSCIFKDEAKSDLATMRYTVSEIKEIPLKNFILNESQFDAFTYALESEIALIQGPPGTGKSYIGLQLAKFLLIEYNWKQWNHLETPLLIVCYTNHALDQFLKGISEFADDKIVRVGSRCKDRVLIKYMMHQWRKEFSDQSHRALIGQCKRLEAEIYKSRRHLKQLNSGLACRDAMNFYIDYDFITDERFIEWLTLFNPAKKIYELDAEIIRQLIKRGIKEDMAREAYASAYTKRKKDEDGNIDDINVDDLYQQIKRKNFYMGMYPKYTRNWPYIKDIDEVMGLGYCEKVAIVLLQNAEMNVNIIKEECRIFPVKLNKLAEELYDSDGEEEMEEDPDLQAKKEEEKERRKQERKLPLEVEEFGNYIRSVPKMEDNERDEITDIWELPLQKRWRLYQHWVSQAIILTKQSLEKNEYEYFYRKKELNELNKELDKIILNSAKVIGMTTTGAAKYQSYLEELKPAIVIAEEAAEVLEAHIFTSLTSSCQQLILIGDHQQLRPRIAEYKLIDYHFDVSLFERLIRNGCSHKMLTTQHRMRPEISSMMQKHFYDDLLNSEIVLSRPNVKGLTKDVAYIQHSNPEIYNEEVESRKNIFEVDFALSLAKYFGQQGYKSKQITILCTYSDQRYNLRRLAKEMFGKNDIRIENVDNFQGEESDIIILSLVRSESESGKIGYLNIKNRICVALSRARIGMYVIGNIDYLAHAASTPLWSEIRCTLENEDIISDKLTTKCQKHGTEQIIQNFKDFQTKCPEGGCQLKCDEKLECGHECRLFCHGYDMEHKRYECEQPCSRICLHGEACKKLCYQECDPCESCEDGNCFYFIDESDVADEEETEEVEPEKVAEVVYPRNADIDFFLG